MPLEVDVAYECPYCGETNFLGVDPTAGARQQLTEDCPVCCSPISFTIGIDKDGDPTIEAAERDD